MRTPDRREVLRTLGVLGTVVIAGCAGNSTDPLPGEDGETHENEPEDTDDEEPAAPAVSVREIDAPSWVELGEPFTVGVVVENQGNATGTVERELADQESGAILAEIDLELSPGETRRWESPPIVRDRIPSSGRLDIGLSDGELSTLVDVVRPLSLGERHVYEDGVEVRIDAFVLKDDYEYELGTGREVLEAEAGRSFLFVYLTVDVPRSTESFPSLPDRSAIGIDVDGERHEPIRPQFYPANEPLEHGARKRHSRVDLGDVASGLAAYDPDVIERTATVPPDERQLGGRDPIHPGQSSWVLHSVPTALDLRGLTVLLSR